MDKLINKIGAIYLNPIKPKKLLLANLYTIFDKYDSDDWKRKINSDYFCGILKNNFVIEDNKDFRLKIIIPPTCSGKNKIENIITREREYFEIYKVLQGEIFYTDFEHNNLTLGKNKIIFGEKTSPIYRNYSIKNDSFMLKFEDKSDKLR